MRNLVGLLMGCCAVGAAAGELPEPRQRVDSLVSQYCLDCHSGEEASAGFDLDQLGPLSGVGKDGWNPAPAEAMWRRLRARQMPPLDAERPSEREYHEALAALETLLDGHANQHPNPGRTESIRRLTRTEYRNAIRDLLALEVDVEELLPVDESAHGFDNVTVGELSPLLLSRYMAAAEKIAAQAIGASASGPRGLVFRLPPDRSQEDHVEGLPFGTRGGGVFTHQFTHAGEYDVRLRLTRDRDEHVEGLFGKHEIDLLVDRDLANRFTVEAPSQVKGQSYENVDHTTVDNHLKKRIKLDAGVHRIGVTFPRKSGSIPEIKRQPFEASFNRHRHPRRAPALLEVSVYGPIEAGEPGDTPSRRRVLGDTPQQPTDPTAAARRVLGRLMRLAYRRPVTEEDLAGPMRFFAQRSAEGRFDAGVEAALASVLVSPHFLFRVEAEPSHAEPGSIYTVSDPELASRLAFFLWSSLPDEELLAHAEAGRLRQEGLLQSQVERMLRDPRSDSLVENFASQWLHLRNLQNFHPDMRRFVDFDDNLRQAMRRETELLMASVIREDRSVLDLISTDTTHLNERLATHYGIPGVRGSHFRPVTVAPASHRGGLLRQGGVLAVTSYAHRTSPTIRGYWVLKNLLGVPPPPPPPDVPDLEKAASDEATTVRDLLEIHRSNPACAACHDLMDPIGLALENYDAVGRWREREGEEPIDASGVLPDGSLVEGVSDLEANLLARPEAFVGTMIEKLFTFALGRGVEPTDMPAVRRVVRLAAEDDYRFSSIVLGIVSSDTFQKRAAR